MADTEGLARLLGPLLHQLVDQLALTLGEGAELALVEAEAAALMASTSEMATAVSGSSVPSGRPPAPGEAARRRGSRGGVAAGRGYGVEQANPQPRWSRWFTQPSPK